MAYTYRNKKTGDVITLNRKATTAFWEEVEPEEDGSFEEETFEEETFEEETFDEDPQFDELPEAEDALDEPVEEDPKKTGRRGKK